MNIIPTGRIAGGTPSFSQMAMIVFGCPVILGLVLCMLWLNPGRIWSETTALQARTIDHRPAIVATLTATAWRCAPLSTQHRWEQTLRDDYPGRELLVVAQGREPAQCPKPALFDNWMN